MIVKKDSIEKVKEIVEEGQKGAKVRLMKAEDIFEAIEKAEAKLQSFGIPKKYWIGCRIYIDPEALPLNYMFEAKGTAAMLKRKASGWDLISVYRKKCQNKPYGDFRKVRLVLSKTAIENIPEQIL